MIIKIKNSKKKIINFRNFCIIYFVKILINLSSIIKWFFKNIIKNNFQIEYFKYVKKYIKYIKIWFFISFMLFVFIKIFKISKRKLIIISHVPIYYLKMIIGLSNLQILTFENFRDIFIIIKLIFKNKIRFMIFIKIN